MPEASGTEGLIGLLKEKGVVRRRSHLAVWGWIQKFGTAMPGIFHQGGLPDVVVVDEAPLMEGRRDCYVWVAIDPVTKAIVYVAVTQVRISLEKIQRSGRARPDLTEPDDGGGDDYPRCGIPDIHSQSAREKRPETM
jgi:hypothetical protein